jgi:uncharacterized protein DUF6263
MRRLPLLAVVAVAAVACGGSPKPVQTAPLPDDPPPVTPPVTPPVAEPKSVAAAPPVGTPAAAPTPVEATIPAQQTTVKIVSDGKGKKEVVRYTSKAGARQPIELAIDFSSRQDSDEQIVPTIVLTGDAETTTVDPDGGTAYTVTVTSMDARPVVGSRVPVDKFKAVLGTLAGLTIGGKLAASGAAGAVTLRIARPLDHAAEALELLRVTLPVMPVLPKEAVGVGAKWQATTTAKLAERLDITHVTDYELVAHKGATWTIKGTTKISGKDQDIDTSKISGITGSGTSETTITDGALYPTYKSSIETQFKGSEQDKSIQFAIKVGGAVTPKTP